jgi:hypothetical protein
MSENLPGDLAETFPADLRSFYSLCLLSLVLGSLALAFGLRFIVSAVATMTGSGGPQPLSLVEAFAGWAAAVIGFRWVLSGARILRGVSGILRDYQALEGSARLESPAGAESAGGAILPQAIDGLALRMMAHYRENWKTYWKIAPISRLGGWIFICLGVLYFIDGFPAWKAASGSTYILPFFAGGLSVALGAAAILVSSRFSAWARAWDRRLIDAGQGGEILQADQGCP